MTPALKMRGRPMHWDEGLPNAPDQNSRGSTDPSTKNDEGTPNALNSLNSD